MKKPGITIMLISMALKMKNDILFCSKARRFYAFNNPIYKDSRPIEITLA